MVIRSYVFLPELNIGTCIVWSIGERSLVYVEDPNFLAITSKSEVFSICNSNISHSIAILTILLAQHVMTYIVFAGFRNQLPITQVVGFHGQAPA